MRTIVVVTAFVLLALVSASAEAQSLLAGVKTDQERYGLSQPVNITYAVQNQTNRPLTLNFNSSKQYDLYVTDDSGMEVWRMSHGRAYAQALTAITLAPGERKAFIYTWNQKDNDGNQLPPGTYKVWGVLTARDVKVAPVSRQTALGKGPAVVIANIGSIVASSNTFVGNTVSVDAVYRGYKADPDAPACKPGPPVTRADFVIKDSTGCIYVTGQTTMDPVNDVGKNVRVLGVVRKTDKGQPYIELQNLTVMASSRGEG